MVESIQGHFYALPMTSPQQQSSHLELMPPEAPAVVEQEAKQCDMEDTVTPPSSDVCPPPPPVLLLAPHSCIDDLQKVLKSGAVIAPLEVTKIVACGHLLLLHTPSFNVRDVD